ncbi:MAG: EF-P lysine aminoacylase EpmA [Thermoguttaceae bacterium]|nr:EF-P lysine aminoacylase EpmA [Thermoguttaceae bacterium]MDW8078798.1 EF-P lysine aminoacylase EpmA [Thermoguttaceae bacterium]
MSSVSHRGDWRPTASLEILERRAQLLGAVRAFFWQRGFLEVETPLLSADTIVDRHIDPLAVPIPPPSVKRSTPKAALENEAATVNHDSPAWVAGWDRDQFVRQMWLQTSPEFGMKRLLAAGASAIFQITKAFRWAERGPLHNPEFTMVEWYRVGDGLEAGMGLLAELAQVVLTTAPAEFVRYKEVFELYTGVDPLRASGSQLATVADLHGVPTPDIPYEDTDSWRELLFAELVQPHLGWQRPTIVYDFPATQGGLAKIRSDDPPVAERYELFIRGIELANGYHELSDAGELRRRFEENNRWRVRDGKLSLPQESWLAQALEEAGFPDCCGCALGFDRLVMLAVGATSIDEVIPFPFERA